MTLKDKTIGGGDQQIGINALVYCEELKGSLSEEVEQGRKLKFDGKVQVQDIPLTGKRGQTKLFKARKKQHNIRAGANTNAENRVNVQHDLGVVQSSCQNLGGDGDWVIVNDEDQGISAIPRGSEVTPSKDLGLENEILANFPDGCNRSHTVELKDEDLYLIVPENLTFDAITNILNQAIKENSYKELDKVIQKIGDYEGRSITLDDGSFKNFCSNQLNLDLQNRSDHQHIYSNVLLQYKFDQEELKRDYSVKELILLAIAANDKLAEKYQNILFAEENLSLLPLLVSGQKYIEIFVAKFHGIDGIYDKLKNQAIQLVKPNKIGFFSAIALRKEQELLNTVLIELVLRDLEHMLETSDPDPSYGVLETASLVKNEEFITIVLDAFERYINEPTRDVKDLLKNSFVTLLETAISQEHISTVEYLCKRYINNKGSASYDIYEQAFADNKVITVLNQQILRKIENRGRKEIYDLVLKTALDAGNIAFIEHLCKERPKCSNHVIDYLDQKLKGNEFDNTYESTLIALSNTGNKDIIIHVIVHTQNVSHNEQTIRQIIQNILKSATHYSTDQEDYSLVKKVCYLCTEIDAVNVIFQEECKNFKSSIEKRIEDLEKENRLLQSEALREYNCSYFPDIMNGVAQIVHTAYDAYTEDQKPNEYRENVCSILSLMHIRDILQFSIDVQEYHCHERQNLWNIMYQTPGTFIIRKRSDNVADKLATPVIKSDILSENPKPESASSQQPQKNAVDKRKNIMNNGHASTKQPISGNYKGGEMADDEKNTKGNKEKQASMSPAGSKNEGDQLGSPSLSPQSSVSSGSSSSFVNVSESNGSVTGSSDNGYDKVPSGSGSGSSFEEVGEDENVFTSKSSSPQNIQPGISTSKPSGTGAEGSTTVSSAKGDKKKQTPVQPAKDMAQIDDDDDYDLSWLFLEEGDQIPHTENLEPEPTPEPTSKKSEQVNNTTPPNTKSSNLRIIATSILAIAGVALGVAIAVHLGMLAVGIVVGACCLVAAAVIYCCGPQSSVKDSEIEKVSSEEKEPVSV